ncbi:MAG: GGDEF domain-containing protein [Treponema sp.]|uniref:GGDEF domain-containing protein n=1 Tax=Treponema sp. TaxID=166 RepID=UPI0025E0534B|nr:GGDEF domain-containing protein [Treponema sp.]MBQ8678561.1 GGDEF domain-containing protein [Treponema sp.]
MEQINQRRLSDITFVIDKNLNVKDGNRSFLRLVQKTDFNINLSYILEDSDTQNFKFFLENFGTKQEKRNFIATIKPFENFISCIFTVSREGELFRIVIEELSYSRQLLDKALLESRELTALIQNFDTNYFIFDGKKYTLKNTKDLTTIFTGSKEEFEAYFSKTFKINLYHDDTVAQLKSMFENISNFISNKYYTFLQTDKKLFTIHTLKTSTRSSSLIIGAINLNKDNEPTMNTYSESRDGLTGLYNKKAITEMAIKKINEEKSPCSLIILDADKFKECNDSYGHIFGDRVLVTIASCITDAIKGKGIAGRIGGDEFLIILDLTEEDDIRNVTRNIRTGIQWNITNVEPGSMVTCSMGIARFPLHAKNYEELFQIADKSLYIAKYRGRNCYIIYKPEIHDKIIIENKQVDDRVASGQFYEENVSKKLEILNLLSKVKKDKPASIKKLLEMLREHLQISKITIYDENFDVTYIVGADSIDVRGKYIKSNKHYFQIFNKYGFFHQNNTNVLGSIDGDRYDMYRNANIASILEVLAKDKKDNPRLLICFDLYKPGRSFVRDEVSFALLVARKLSEIL